MSYTIDRNDKKTRVRVRRSTGQAEILVDSKTLSYEVLQTGATFSLLHQGRQIEVVVLRRRDDGADVLVNGAFHAIAFVDEKRSFGSGTSLATQGDVRAVMPGRVVRVHVQPGATVVQGAPLLVLEAMKMENEIKSPIDGVVEKILVTPGATVETGTTMISIGAHHG